MNDVAMSGFFDEMEKIGKLGKLQKTLAIFGGGAAAGGVGLHSGGKALERYRIGKAMQEHQEAMRRRAEEAAG